MMNERIQELHQQAKDYINEMSDADGVYQGKEYMQAVREKFAELIVRECANLTNKYQGVVIQTDRGVVYEYNADLWIKIKEHFGVE